MNIDEKNHLLLNADPDLVDMIKVLKNISQSSKLTVYNIMLGMLLAEDLNQSGN